MKSIVPEVAMLSDVNSLSLQLMKSRRRDYERYFIRTVQPKHRFMIILGERGVGKTTTLIQYLLSHSEGDFHSDKILYVQSDHFLVQQTTLYEIAESFTQMGGKYIAFDEIHKYPDWSMELKSIYDTFPELKIYASGSSALEIHKGSHDLSRRALLKKMYGLSFREFIELKYEIKLESYDLTDILKNHTKIAFHVCQLADDNNLKILPLFREYLQSGFYPYFLEEESVQELLLLIEQNIHTTIESDLVAIHPSLTGSSVKKIKQLMSYIAGTVPFTPNWKKIKTIIGVSDDRTLKNYFKYLQDSMIIFLLTSSSKKLRQLEVNEKVLLSNPNLLHALSYNNIDIGTIRETFFISQLAVKHEVSAPAEGDFLIDDLYTFEVGGKKKSFSQLRSASQGYVAADDIETGSKNKIPLWVFGFLY
jgi:predicted AAA+ superfamily ATPase